MRKLRIGDRAILKPPRWHERGFVWLAEPIPCRVMGEGEDFMSHARIVEVGFNHSAIAQLACAWVTEDRLVPLTWQGRPGLRVAVGR